MLYNFRHFPEPFIAPCRGPQTFGLESKTAAVAIALSLPPCLAQRRDCGIEQRNSLRFV